MNMNTKPVLTGHIYDGGSFADASTSGSIDLRHNKSIGEENYQMAESSTTRTPAPEGKTWGQVYYEEVEELVSGGMKNADAVRQVAEKYGKEVNAVRGGIFQYKKAHVNSGSSATVTPTRRGRRQTTRSYDEYMADARQALEAARALIDQEVNEAKTALDAAQEHYNNVLASVKERKADIEKKLKALA